MTKRVSAVPPRRFVDAEGVHWLVYEHLSSFDRRTRPTLVFDSEYVVRRVRDFPSRWRDLSDDDLAALSWSR